MRRFLLALVWLAGCGSGDPSGPVAGDLAAPGQAGRPESVLLIVSDTLRADVLSCYGGRAKTPNLCALAKRGVLFENAYANAPWTPPASVSLLTGQYPSVHARAGSGDRFYFVGEEEQLLAEAAGDAGYDALAFIGTRVAVQPNGFQGYKDIDLGRVASLSRAKRLEPRLAFSHRGPRYRRLAAPLVYLLQPRDAPFLAILWIHDPHASYDPPGPFLDPSRLPPGLPKPLAHYRGLGHLDRPAEGLSPLREQAAELSEPEREALVRLYEMEVESVDDRVGLVLSALEFAGRADDTWVVFTADHGEGFGEHGLYLHGNSLFDELVHVPLIVAGPRAAGGRRVSQPVSQVDLVPTLRDLLGLDCCGAAQGSSLAPILLGARDPEAERAVYLEAPQRLAGLTGLVQGGFKLIENAETGARQLFELARDPAERSDVAAREPERVKRMAGILAARRAENQALRARLEAPPSESELEAAERNTLRELRALGYVE